MFWKIKQSLAAKKVITFLLEIKRFENSPPKYLYSKDLVKPYMKKFHGWSDEKCEDVFEFMCAHGLSDTGCHMLTHKAVELYNTNIITMLFFHVSQPMNLILNFITALSTAIMAFLMF